MTTDQNHGPKPLLWSKCVVFLPLFRDLPLDLCPIFFFFFFSIWELDTTSALEMVSNDIPGKCLLQKKNEKNKELASWGFTLWWFDFLVW